MEIERNRYLEKLIRTRKNGLVKIITGIRRCGKSYLLFNIFYDYLVSEGVDPKNIITLALDDDDNEQYRDAKELSRYLKEKVSDPSKEYVIMVDEVQMAITEEELKGKEEVRLYGLFNSLLRKKNVDVYVTGSNSKLLSKDVLTEFRGRGFEIRLNPLTFSEFMSVYDGDKYDGWQEYMRYGGLPPVVLQQGEEEKKLILNQLLTMTYMKDIIARHKIRNKDEFAELIDILASAIGSLTNPEKLSKTFHSTKNITISYNTISSYIEYLSDAFLIEGVNRYDVKGKAYMTTPKKYYFSDIGIRNFKLNFRQMEETHIMENIIYNELKARGYSVDVGVVETYEENEKGNTVRKKLEIDFICNSSPKRYYIQSALNMDDAEKEKTELRPLLLTNDSFKKVIVSKSYGKRWVDEMGIMRIGIVDFLLDENSLDW